MLTTQWCQRQIADHFRTPYISVWRNISNHYFLLSFFFFGGGGGGRWVAYYALVFVTSQDMIIDPNVCAAVV